MRNKPTHIVAGLLAVTAVVVPIALAQSTAPSSQDSRALTLVQRGTSITVDDKYVYVLSGGQLARIDKSSGQAAGQLGASGWADAGAPSGGTSTGTATGSTGTATGSTR